MSKLYRITGLLAFLSGSVLAQPAPTPLPQYSAAQRGRQQALQQTLTQQRNENYQKALAVARKQGRAVEEPAGDGQTRILRGLDESTGNLLYDISFTNVRAAQTTRTTTLQSGGSFGVSFNGSSAPVLNRLGMWEIGGTYTDHPEFEGRVIQQDNANSSNREGESVYHATHVAGTLVARGINPVARGMANAARLRAWDASNDVSEMTTAGTAAGSEMILSNHSYGSITGWRLNSSRTTTNKWEWWGDTTLSATQDFKFGQYDNAARNWDQVAIAAPYYLIVKSAGNNHGDIGPPANEPYFLIQHSGRQSITPREPQTGYDNIPTYGNAKNILTVGAAFAITNSYTRPADVVIAPFSSWGPTDDGRIKPDIVGVGVNVTSTSSNSATPYGSSSGTSMSSPNVTGSLLLVQEYYASRNNGRIMRAATLKGLALHTADEAGLAPGPDYQFGWGLLNVERAAQAIRSAGQTSRIEELTLTQGNSYSVAVVASGQGPLVATISWTDPETTVATGTARINDRTPKLVHDLDLRIADGSTTTQPWILDPENPANPATRGDNIRDNVEQVLVANAVPGRTYVIRVNHKGTLRNAQEYSLLVSGVGGPTYCDSRATSQTDTKIARVQIGTTVDQAGATGCTTYTDFTSLTNVAEAQANLPLPLTVTTGTCGAARNAIVKIFADWNGNGTFTDAGESLGTSGVLNGSGTFVGNITAPASVSAGTIVRLRIVAQETTDANAVQGCGTYANGETQEFLVRIVRTQNDVAAMAFVQPTDQIVCAGTQTVSVRVRNLGGVDQTNLPVTLQVTTNNQPVASLSRSVNLLRANRDALLTFELPTSVSLTPGQTYRFTTRIGLATDQDTTNNTFTVTRMIGTGTVTGSFAALLCGTDPSVRLTNAGQGTAFWYDAAVGGTLLAAGNLTSAPNRSVYYAAINDFSGRLGPASKADFRGGSYAGNFGPQPIITTRVPLRIERARIYTGAPGRLTFSVRKYDETIISTVTLDVVATRTLPASATIAGGQQADDPNDQGAIYPLNLTIPEPGEYKIAVEYEEGVTIFRSNTALAGQSFTFPYQLRTTSGDVLASTKGSLFNNAQAGTIDTLRTAWYYFYDMQLRPLACPTPQRVAVTPQTRPAPTATLTSVGAVTACQGNAVVLRGAATTAVSGEALGFRWLRDGQLIANATSQTYAAAEAGSYAVQVTSGCPPVSSSAISVSIISAQVPVIVQTGLTLASNVPSGNQWLLAGVPIAGATAQTLLAPQTGRYSVRANANGCGEAISAETFVTILATEPLLAAGLRAYPNPTTNRLTVEVDAPTNVPAPSPDPIARLIDARGVLQQELLMTRTLAKYQAVFDVSHLPPGMFFVQVLRDPAQPPAVKSVLRQ